MTTLPITKRGAEKLKAELHQLKTVDRPWVINAISEARAQGDYTRAQTLAERAQTLAPHGAHGLTGARTRARANCVLASHNKFTCTRTTPCARAARALRGFQACAHPCGGVRYTRAVAGARFHPYA